MFRSIPLFRKGGGKFLKKLSLSLSRALRNFLGANILIVGSLKKKRKNPNTRGFDLKHS